MLLEEGFDLDNPGQIDPARLNAALSRAMEHYNRALFTCTGSRRDQALLILRRFTLAFDAGNDTIAQRVLDEVEPEPDGDWPAISHVIGVALELLDQWHTDPALRKGLSSTTLSSWSKPARASGRDILARARQGRAFASLDELHRRHNGLAVFEGSALVVAASLITLAGRERISVAELADRTLIPDEKRAFPQLPEVDLTVLDQFSRWLRGQPEDDLLSIGEQTEMLQTLFATARQMGADPHTSDGVIDLADVFLDVEEDDDAEFAFEALAVLHDYVDFLIETSEDPSVWDEAHDFVEEALEAQIPGSDAIAEAFDASEQIDLEDRRIAFAATRIVQMVGPLLEWIGKGRPVAPSGGVRRADIAKVAGMLDISAIGVNKLPPETPDGMALFDLDTPVSESRTIHAMAMKDVPVLAAWWATLQVADLIEVRGSRVYLGSDAGQWLAEPLPPFELADMVIGVFVAELLSQEESSLAGYTFPEHVLAQTMARLLRALAPGLELEVAPQTDRDTVLAGRSLGMLDQLRSVGLLEAGPDGELIVPQALRGAVARGVILLMASFVTDPGEDPGR